MKRIAFLLSIIAVLFACTPSDNTESGVSEKNSVKYVKELSSGFTSNLNCFVVSDEKYSFEYDEQKRVTKIIYSKSRSPQSVGDKDYPGYSYQNYCILDYSNPACINCKSYYQGLAASSELWSSFNCFLNENNLIEKAAMDWAVMSGSGQGWTYTFSHQNGHLTTMERKRTDVIEKWAYYFERNDGLLSYQEWYNDALQSEGVLDWQYDNPKINLDWSMLSAFSEGFFFGASGDNGLLTFAPVFLGYAGSLSAKAPESQNLFNGVLGCPLSDSMTSTGLNTGHRVTMNADSPERSKMTVESDADGCPVKMTFTAKLDKWCYEYDYTVDEHGQITPVPGTEQYYKVADNIGTYSRTINFKYL